MSDGNDAAPPGADAAGTAAATAAEPSDLQILGGGVEIVVTKNDGSQETVKVRQLPWRDLPDFGALQGDEAGLVELLCGQSATQGMEKLRNARTTEFRFLELMRGAVFEQIPLIEKELARVRAEIEVLEKNERWSDSLTEDSLIAILEMGLRLNEKRFGRWAQRRKKHTGQMMKGITESLSAKSPPAST